MKKLFGFIMFIGLLVAQAASASTLLTSDFKHHEHIGFVDGTGEIETVFDNKLKITAVSLSTGYGNSMLYNLNVHNNPASHVYYFRKNAVLLMYDFVLGVNGIGLRFENMTDSPLVIHWNESAIQIGEESSMPLVDKLQYTDNGKPIKPGDTVIPAKSSIQVKVYSTTRINGIDGVDLWAKKTWENITTPISDDGTTRIFVTVKVEENGANKYYSYRSPCLDLPTDYLAQCKANAAK